MKNSTATVICAGCLSLAVAGLTLDYFATHDIYEKVTQIDGKPIDLRRIGVWVPRCDAEHFWGKMLTYRNDDTGVPGDIYLKSGRACWDWKTGEWVVTPNIGHFWF